MAPLLIELFAGLHGWGEGAVAAGFRVVGFDIDDMCAKFDIPRPAGDIQLVLQDVTTLHGRQFKDAALIVASPPCQAYSYRAMPWSRAKALPPPDNTLFDACFRIQREASEAAGRHIPMVVENVRGAQKWVGRSRWNYGSYHLWGDVPALMPITKAVKVPGFRFDGSIKSFQTAAVKAGKANADPKLMRDWGRKQEGSGPNREQSSWDRGHKVPGFRFDGSGRSFQTASVNGLKGIPHKPTGHWTNPDENGIKQGGDWFNAEQPSVSRMFSSKSIGRKRASAMIAKIPFPLAAHIARCFLP